ncbi:hypothetical protein HK104_001968 [Borealophlyctis nickersoniae]|nr:hypothetical protein HK104_001968 [Borealophlyctis nickersoniae]
MDKYRRKEVGEEAEPTLGENDLKVTINGKLKKYESTAFSLLKDPNRSHITVYGTAKAINKAVTLAEILKRKAPAELGGRQLRQETEIGSVEAVDVWESVEGDLDR